MALASAALATLVPRHAGAAAIDAWTDRTGVVARFGDRLVSTYDLTLMIAYRRMEAGAALDPVPQSGEWTEALAAVFNQAVLLDAADRAQANFPDIARIRADAERLLDLYGGGDAYRFWNATGIPFPRIEEEVRRRYVVERYVTEVLGDQTRVGDDEIAATYARRVTEMGGAPLERMRGQVRRLIVAERLRAELERLRDRFLDRVEVEILDPTYRLDDLKRVGGRTLPSLEER